MTTIEVNGREFIPVKYAEALVEEERVQFHYDLEDIKTEIEKKDQCGSLTVADQYYSKGLEDALAIVNKYAEKAEERWAKHE